MINIFVTHFDEWDDLKDKNPEKF